MPQALSAQSVENNMVSRVGIYNYFSSKYGIRKIRKSRKSSVKSLQKANTREECCKEGVEGSEEGREGGGSYQGSS